jgi:hypothetical protein
LDGIFSLTVFFGASPKKQNPPSHALRRVHARFSLNFFAPASCVLQIGAGQFFLVQGLTTTLVI